MKRLIIFLVGVCSAIVCKAQVDSLQTNMNLRDSLLMSIYKVDSLNTAINVVESMVGRYEIYPTQNTHVHLRLDTATGEIYMVYFQIGEDWEKELIKICEPLFYPKINDRLVSGRFKLHPTTNIYNFILLDTVYGDCWDVQWSYEKNKRYRGRRFY